MATAGFVPAVPGGGFDPGPLLWVAFAFLAGRWLGLAWSRRTAGPLLALGLLIGLVGDRWGAVPAAAACLALLLPAASLGRPPASPRSPGRPH
ncbi:MAG TPA: hypothetical protein VNO17_06920 [Actinomycetota bacterium]|nr:hypothetical protein [Actinomycetota bacterium]